MADGALERVSRTCPIGDAWFAERAADAPAAARVDGREVDFADAVEEAAAILGEARLPLVCGLGQTDCESQRAAVALAEAVGAVIDPAGPWDDGAAGAAAQAIGLSTATFGELRDRAELVVVWRADPVASHPRLLPRLRLDRAGRAAGARSSSSTRSARRPPRRRTSSSSCRAELDFEALWAMRALVRDVPLDRDLAARLPLDALEQPRGPPTRVRVRGAAARARRVRERARAARARARPGPHRARRRAAAAPRTATRAAPRTCSPGRPATRRP